MLDLPKPLGLEFQSNITKLVIKNMDDIHSNKIRSEQIEETP